MLARTRRLIAVLALAGGCCVLGFYGAEAASPQNKGASRLPFASAVEQRMETINELKAIRNLLKEQNRLLKQQNEIFRGLIPEKSPREKR